MNDGRDWRTQVLEVLAGIAPEAAAGTLDPARPIRDQVDFDSVDFLNFVLALEQATGTRVAEADWPRLASIDGCVRYFGGRADRRAGAA